MKSEKRELFEQCHNRELILYDAAARYLKELNASGEEITPKEWRREINLLTAQKQVNSIDMKAIREELKAVERFRKAADQGHAKAQYKLGDCYYFGRGVEQDYAQAVQWYQKAADQDNAWAQYSLGHCYYLGQGVKKDRAQAVQWYRKAADQDHKKAQLALADCYENGLGVPKDPSLAKEWREKAKNNYG